MAVGNYLSVLNEGRVAKRIIGAVGTLDLHTHFRIRPLLKFFGAQTAVQTNAWKVIEVGCGFGLNLFEIAKTARVVAEGYDLNCTDIAAANKIKEACFPMSSLSFFCQDVTKKQDFDDGYDFALCIDFLEHVDDPRAVLVELEARIVQGGQIVVSVPTPLYPKVFGRRFHEEVGHVRDGFTLDELTELFGNDYELVTSEYSAGAVTGIGCFLYYRFVRSLGSKYIRIPLTLILHGLFRFADVWRKPNFSCSLFAVYRKISR